MKRLRFLLSLPLVLLLFCAASLAFEAATFKPEPTAIAVPAEGFMFGCRVYECEFPWGCPALNMETGQKVFFRHGDLICSDDPTFDTRPFRGGNGGWCPLSPQRAK